MKLVLTILYGLIAISCFSQKNEEEILKDRKKHEEMLKDTASHYLNSEDLKEFHGLDYFDFDPDYQITATLTKSKGKKFKMPTTTERTPVYRRYGYIDFTFHDTNCRLTVYQNIKLMKRKEYKDYLFVPFRDGTSGKQTYGGGRFMDLRIPEGEVIKVDFNIAYNPYCAYSHRYSCPIPPKENTLIINIEAGEKNPIGH